MAKKSGNNKLLLVAAVAGLAYYLYKKSAPAAASPVSSAVSPVLNGQPVTTSVQAVPATDPRIVEIQKWVTTLPADRQARINAALQIMSDAEVSGLYDIVLNDFYGNGITTPAQRAFWDAWREKYNTN